MTLMQTNLYDQTMQCTVISRVILITSILYVNKNEIQSNLV